MKPFELLKVTDIDKRFGTLSNRYGIPRALELTYQDYFNSDCVICHGFRNLFVGEPKEQLYFIIKREWSYQAFIFDEKINFGKGALVEQPLYIFSVKDLVIDNKTEFELMKTKLLLKRIEQEN